MRDNIQHIVIILPGFAAGETDVNCLPMQQSFLKALHAAYPHWKIRVIALEYPHTNKPYSWHGIPITPFGGRNRGGLQRFLLKRRVYAQLKCWHQAEPVSGILSFWTGLATEICCRFGRKHGIRHFGWIMGQDARPGNRYALRNNYRPEELIALSDSLQERYEKTYGVRPAHVITPGITAQHNASVKYPLRVIGAGSLIPLKRFDLFIEVIAEVKKKLPQTEAVIYGDGPLKEVLQQQIVRLGLQGTIRLAGQVPHPELLQHMAEARVLLHPSSFEGFSGVCLEARTAGVPVISYCQPMSEELPGWYTAPDKQSMIRMLLTELLLPYEPDPVVWHSMQETAERIMALFTGHNAARETASFSAV